MVMLPMILKGRNGLNGVRKKWSNYTNTNYKLCTKKSLKMYGKEMVNSSSIVKNYHTAKSTIVYPSRTCSSTHSNYSNK